ncbi:hypothetical protein ES703_118519 [subsurface metagenome]
MAEVKLRKDFTGTLVPKVSTDNLYIDLNFTYKGPAQTLSIDTSSGKKGIWGDYDQESPTYRNPFPVSKSDTPRSYTFRCYIPLAFWGDRIIEDCAVEIKISGEGVYDSAVLWDAYTVNVGVPPVEKYTLTTSVSPSGAGYVVGGGTYDAGEVVMVYAESSPGYAFDHWGGDASGTWSPTYITMDRNKHVTAYFKTVAPPPEEHSLSVDVESTYGEIVGYVTYSPSLFTYPHGTVVSFTAHMFDAYKATYGFSRWYVNGVVVSYAQTMSITMDEDKVVIARFEWVGW